jgi:FKBP-type peptidyl-prolyl cis-trans isomerase
MFNFNKFELWGMAVSVFIMAFAVYLVQVNSLLFRGVQINEQSAQVINTTQHGVVIVSKSDNENEARKEALLSAIDDQGKLNSMVIDDVKIGTGKVVEDGDVVVVDYIGTFQGGVEFDNSKKRGVPFEFKVGGGMVIEGWEKGVLGMKVGGQRILVIPPELAYGERAVGPIPANSTLVFSIELLGVK